MADITKWDIEDQAFWDSKGKGIATRNLAISIPSLLCGFAVWLYWGIITVQMLNLGFPFAKAELFTLTAIAGFTGATLRIPSTFFIRIAGGRNTIFFTTALLMIPAIGTGFALKDNSTPLWVFQVLALLSGFGGGNFASSMSNISFFFPKRMQGLALGLNAGLGNAGYYACARAPMAVLTAILFVFCAPVRAAEPETAPMKKADPFETAAKQLKDDHPMVRRQGAQRLGRMRDPRAIPLLRKALKDEHPYVRSEIINTLGRMRVREAAGDIMGRLKDKNAQVRQAAAISLSYLADPTSIDPLIKALDDESPGVRYAAARTLGNLRAQKAAPKLGKLMKSTDEGMRQAAAGALGRIAAPDSAKILAKALKDDNVNVRREAVKALGSLGAKEYVEDIKPLLRDPDTQVSIYAASSLGKLGDSAGEPVLIRLLADTDAGMRQRAANALGAFGSKKKGYPALKKAFAKEKQANAKQMMRFALAQIKARHGIKEEPAPKRSKKKR